MMMMMKKKIIKIFKELKIKHKKYSNQSQMNMIMKNSGNIL